MILSMFFVLLIFCEETLSGKIIFNGMHASDSHVGSMLPVATRLLEEGHDVHFLESHSKPKAYKYPPNITYTYMKLPQDEFLQKNVLPSMWTKCYGPGDFPKGWFTGDTALKGMHADYNEKLTALMNESWDMAVADELFSVSSYALGLLSKRRGSSYVVMATCATTHIMRYHFSLGGNTLQRPSMFTPVRFPHSIESFYSRLVAVAHGIRISVGIHLVTTYKAIEGLRLVGVENFHLSKLAQQSSYYFVDELNPLVWPAPTSTDVVYVGNSCPKAGELPSDYKDFLEDPTSKGTILIAFGSNVVWEYAPERLTRAFVDGINMLKDYRIVFAFNGDVDQLKGVGSHCRVTKWAPQKEILFHNRTKVYVSHGGLKSMKDTICGTVPVVVMPLFAEQPHNAELGRQAGFADILDKTSVTADIFTSTVRRLAEDPQYKRNVIRIKGLFLDRIVPSLDLAGFATRRSIKTASNCFPTFKRKGMYLSLFQHLHIPVVASVIGLLIVLF